MNALEIQDDDFELEDSRALKEMKFTEIKFKELKLIPENKFRNDIIFGASTSKQEFIDKLIQSVEKIKNIQTTVKKDKENWKLECLIEGKSKVTLALDFQDLEGKIGASFYKVEGNCFDFHKVKKQFLDMLSMQMWYNYF